MIKSDQNAQPALDAFLGRVSDDLAQLRLGQQHAAVVLALAVNKPNPRFSPALLERLLGELPTKAAAASLGNSKLALWVPRTTKEETLVIARLLRSSVTRSPQRTDQSSPLTPIDLTQKLGCSLGIVFANQDNWDADALLRTADVTAGLALLADSNRIKIADQVRRNPAAVS